MHKEDKTLEKSINYIGRSYLPTFVFFVPYSKPKSAAITPRPEKEKIAKLSPNLRLEGELHLQQSSLLLSIKKEERKISFRGYLFFLFLGSLSVCLC